jgi:protocatechuate 3,4-dioxygenase, beta subunit
MHNYISRRRWLRGASVAAGGLLVPSWAAWAEHLLATAAMTEGPFYPRQLPLDDDNDLTHVKGQAGVAKGVLLDLSGRVVDADGRALRDTQVEIWQCNAFGRYHHPDAPATGPIDVNFQGFGRTVTDAEGRYRFRTIKPVPYPGRAPHIHFKLRGRGIGEFTTQMFVAGEALNERDFLYRSLADRESRARQSATLLAVPGSVPGALQASYDIVPGA